MSSNTEIQLGALRKSLRRYPIVPELHDIWHVFPKLWIFFIVYYHTILMFSKQFFKEGKTIAHSYIRSSWLVQEVCLTVSFR